MVTQIIKRQIPLDPEVFLLNIFPDEWKKKEKYLILHVLTAARILLAMGWKGEQVPTKGQWRNKIMDVAELDNLTQKVNGKMNNTFQNVWSPFYRWLAQIDASQ